MTRGRLALCAPLCAAALFFVPQAAFAGKIFFSTSNTLDGTVAVSNPVINLPAPGGIGTLYIWVTDETPVTPQPGQGLSSAGFAFTVTRSGTSASISDIDISNYTLRSTLAATGTDLGPTAQDRWSAVTVNSMGGDLNAVVVSSVSQAGAGSPGFNPLNDGLHLNPGSATNGTLDPGYDKTAHAFLHGVLTYSATPGTTTINLGQSALGIVVGSSNGVIDLTSQFTYGSATINVVPEPSSIVLMAVAGAIALAAKRRQR
jgi:hypothetical protein